MSFLLSLYSAILSLPLTILLRTPYASSYKTYLNNVCFSISFVNCVYFCSIHHPRLTILFPCPRQIYCISKGTVNSDITPQTSVSQKLEFRVFFVVLLRMKIFSMRRCMYNIFFVHPYSVSGAPSVRSGVQKFPQIPGATSKCQEPGSVTCIASSTLRPHNYMASPRTVQSPGLPRARDLCSPV